ncbi:hypothetical protein ASPZODRAFT_71773 [Penicilliopsis zonata CBS 506.65]|uniref:Histidine acid phosphatase n=1 Tax=Penicilliopsis zonata CBS 506.65 TaxID=1073090 RepID=A0A1L9SBB0_9EURO|nr:hypothetical protein ASPZODRAFT_71773 [Penicilliopsis zonata CBS 506.65]OJJ44438.1 hypothetical protein ASPZODRAFT_71773 [Penicilliopsis zonata CBS 506.65]
MVHLYDYASFYPNISAPGWLTDASLGTYGGIFHAPAQQASPPSFGAYAYCSMPHPREEDYWLPEPVENGSVKAELVYLEYLQRHHRRTPYNILPGGENQPYDCDDIHPYLYAGSPLEEGPIRVYADTYSDSANPFLHDYVNGSCQYPQLTVGGLLDAYHHGRDLWAVYGARLELLPASPDGSSIWLRSSSSPLTQASAGGVLRGIWPEYSGALPLHQQAAAIDTVDRGFPCPAREAVLDKIQSSAEWEAALGATRSLRESLAELFDANTSAWMSTFDHFADNFQARLCNGYQLPCRREEEDSSCVTHEQVEAVFRAGDWMWDFWFRASQDAARYITLVEGMFIGEILARLNAVVRGEQDLVYSHTFVHDGDVGPILGALGITSLRWPGMASNIAIEVWKSDGLFARVLYCGHPIQTVHGSLDWTPLGELIQILQPFVPEDIVKMCKQNIDKR